MIVTYPDTYDNEAEFVFDEICPFEVNHLMEFNEIQTDLDNIATDPILDTLDNPNPDDSDSHNNDPDPDIEEQFIEFQLHELQAIERQREQY